MSEIDRLYRRFVRTGDREALATLYDRIAPDLLLVASHRLGDPDAAQDAVQAAFLAVMERRGQHDPSRPVRPWLLGAVLNQGRVRRRAEARRPDPRRAEPAAAADPGEAAAAEELVCAVHDSVARLPDTYRAVLDLRLRRGLAPHEIAARLDRPAATVRSQLARGLAEVRRALPPGFAAAVTLLAASEVSAAAGKPVVVSAAGAAGAAGAATAAMSAPLKIGAICFTLGLAVALPILILAGATPAVDPLLTEWDDSPLLEAAHASTATRPDDPPARADRPTAPGGNAANPATTDAPPPTDRPSEARRWMLHGKVHVWPDKPAPAKCRIEVWLRNTAISDGPRTEPFATTESDASGCFRVDLERLRKLHPRDLSCIELGLLATAPGLARESSVSDIPEDPSLPYRAEDDIYLEPAAVLTGRVRGADGLAVRNGHVGFADPTDPDALEESEIVDGRYRLIVRAPGRVLVRAAVAGRGVSRDLPVDVHALETFELPDLVLEAGGVLDGRAVFPDGTPARNIHFAYHAEDQRHYSRWLESGSVKTDDHGRFRVAGLAPRPYVLEPDLDFTDRTRERLQPGDPDPVVRVLTPVVTVNVRDAAGRPRTNLPLRILGWRGAHADRAQAAWNARVGLGALRPTARHFNDWRLDYQDGSLSFAVTPGSFWVVRCQLPDHRVMERALRIAHGRFSYRVDLTLQPLDRAGSLAIRVHDPDDRPMERFFVSLAPERTGIPLPELRGRLFGARRVIQGLTPGRYRLTVAPRQGLLAKETDRCERATLLPITRTIAVREGANHVTLKARLGARLAVQIHRPAPTTTERIPWCDLEVIGPTDTRRTRGLRFYKVRKSGTLSLCEKFTDGRVLVTGRRFRPGTRRVRFRFEGYEPVEVVIPFEAGRLHEAELHLHPRPGKRSQPATPRIAPSPSR